MTDDAAAATAAPQRFTWGTDAVQLEFVHAADAPVALAAVESAGRRDALYTVPFIEVLTVGGGSRPASYRLAHTETGTHFRYDGHTTRTDADGEVLAIRQRGDGLTATAELRTVPGVAAVRATVTVENSGERPVVLRSVASWCAGFTAADTGDDVLAGWERVRGRSDWLGEGRWERTPLRGPEFVPLAEHLTGHNPRGAFVATSDGTWSTGDELPTAALVHPDGRALAWQIEHNGPWRWEIGEDTRGGYVALSGPTDTDSSWTKVLQPGETFTTVPATVVFGSGFEDAVAALTAYRRAARRPHPDNAAMPVVFNDYMNTLDGDPTTEKLLPLIAAAADVGCEVFCIDAGWYDETGDWWDSVGEWQPSTTRFPGGLGEVIDAIRDAGMVPGLWLEPEVVGVRSPLADRLPAEAFLQRHGQRIVEHSRYHLDLRHPAAIAHLDAVVDRLVAEFGVGFFKFDYNIDPGPGTDLDADSVGDGLLQHNRAHLAWLDALLDRHPELVIENCGSGAQRMDFAMLSRLAMQSTSDQQDFTKYPPIAAAAPLSMLPEQAASWAYPQPEMDAERIAFCLVTGLLGRFYVSGYLNLMTAEQRRMVADAIEVAKSLRTHIASAAPFWPAGLPEWDAEWVSLGLGTDEADVVSVWRRGASDSIRLELPHLVGRDVRVETVFPTTLPEWRTDWDAASGTLTVHATDPRPAARTLRLTGAPVRQASPIA
ncbi:alpha-galactosidase [Microbacterium sp. GXF7504]